jgi:hypothetical protein
VEDDDGNSKYASFNVDTSSTNNGDLSISTNRTSPTTSQYANITVETPSSYRGYVNFYVQYRSSTSSSWSKVSSSSYFTADSYLNNGYKFTSSDYGYHTFSSFIRFNRNGYYRLYVEDDNGNENYTTFNVGVSSSNDSSSINGFTTSELRRITDISKLWNSVIAELKRTSTKLKNDTYRQRLSDSLYSDMRDVVNDKSNRAFRDRDDFMSSFNDWLRYSIRNS